jgi:hypothetical protein
MSDTLNQRTGMANLANIQPFHAHALSGQNPPGTGAPTGPGVPFAWIVSPIIIFPFCLMIFVRGCNEFSENYRPADLNSGVTALSHVIFGAIVLVIGIFFLSVAIGKINTYRHRPLPPQPIAYPMKATRVEFLKTYLNNELIVKLNYQVPVDPRASDNSPFHNLLISETEEVLDEVIHRQETAINSDKEQKDSVSKPAFNSDELEYFLVAPFGRAVYESQIPVFRFKISAQIKSASAVPDEVLFEHDVIVGEIIEPTL